MTASVAAVCDRRRSPNIYSAVLPARRETKAKV
jgi:hypothetical protein